VQTRRDLLARSLLLVVGGVAGCSGGSKKDPEPEGFSARFAQYEAAPEPNGDLSKVVWPEYVTEAGPEVKRLYEFQITHGELMRYMPCFCGCGRFAGHRSNRDCYVRKIRGDGSVVFDSMAPT
jgi:hypothetical protein